MVKRCFLVKILGEAGKVYGGCCSLGSTLSLVHDVSTCSQQHLHMHKNMLIN